MNPNTALLASTMRTAAASSSSSIHCHHNHISNQHNDNHHNAPVCCCGIPHHHRHLLQHNRYHHHRRRRCHDDKDSGILRDGRSGFSVAVVVVTAVFSSVVAADRSCFVALLVLATVAGFAGADDVPRFTEEPLSAVIAHHIPVTLRCGVQPPTARVEWLFNGQPLDLSAHPGMRMVTPDNNNDNVYELRFPHFKHGRDSAVNDGEYRCTATFPRGTLVSRPAFLSKPVLGRFPARGDIEIRAPEGGNATIPCVAPAFSNPPAIIKVRAPSGILLDKTQGKVHHLPSGSVVLTDLTASDNGDYTCMAFNNISKHNRTAPYSIRLTVVSRTQGLRPVDSTDIVDDSLSEVNVTWGTSVLLECPLVGIGPPRVQWRKAYSSLPQNHSVTQFGNLRISTVQHEDSQTYICEVDGVQKKINLMVQMPPSIPSGSVRKNVTAQVGRSVRLTCQGKAYPRPWVTWYHNGRKVGEKLALRIQEVKAEDAGIYVCELSNALGQAQSVQMLIVQEPGVSTEDFPGDIASTGKHDKGRNFLISDQHNKRRGRKKKKHGKNKKRRKHRRGKKKSKNNKEKDKMVPPNAPTVSRLSDTAVKVKWTVPENDGLAVALFRIQYKEVKSDVKAENGVWQTLVKDIGPEKREYEVHDLKPGGTYKFRVAAVFSNHNNDNSPNSRRFHLGYSPYPDQVPPRIQPKIVRGEALLREGNHAIGIIWRIPMKEMSSIEGFYIYYKPYESEEKEMRKVLKSTNTTKSVLDHLKPDTDYSIYMKCFNEAGASEMSNTIVVRTFSANTVKGQEPAELPPAEGIDETGPGTETPPATRRVAGGLDEPVILGIVLGIMGIMLLLLLVFVTMCWWKQRQHKRRNQNSASCTKFQDPAHRIYTDSLRKKHPNGGPYPMNGMVLANGHGPHQGQGQGRSGHGDHHQSSHGLNMDVMDEERQVGGLTYGQQLQGPIPYQRDMYSGKPYHHGNGMIPNGTLPGYGHGHNSDNNFNNIRHTHSSDDILMTQGLVPNGVGCMGALPHRNANGSRIGGGYSTEGRYHNSNNNNHPRRHSPPPPSRSRTPRSPFTHNNPPPHHHRARGGSLSHSDDPGSPDESEPLTRREGEETPPPYRRASPSLYESHSGHSRSGRDTGGARGDRKQRYGYNGSYRGVETHEEERVEREEEEEEEEGDEDVEERREEEEGRHHHHPPPSSYRHWMAVSPPPSSSIQSHHSGSKHKRRRKRPHSEREHTMKDQATNTDLSSNGEEGTIEFAVLGISPASSASSGSDSSVASADPVDAKSRTTNGTQCVTMLNTPLTVLAVGSL